MTFVRFPLVGTVTDVNMIVMSQVVNSLVLGRFDVSRGLNTAAPFDSSSLPILALAHFCFCIYTLSNYV